MMSFNQKRLTILATFCLAMVGCDAAVKSKVEAKNQSNPSNVTVVKIGSAIPMTGANAVLGIDTNDGVKLAINEANQEKIVLDGQLVTFEVVTGGDQSDPKMATVVAQRLVDEKVAGVIGHLTSGASIPASTIYNQAGIPMISASVTSPKFTQQGYSNVFRLVPDDNKQGVSLANFAVNTLHSKRIAIVDDATTYGQGLANSFEKSALSAGAVIVKREQTHDKATDFKALLTSISSKNPEVVFFGGMFGQAGAFVKQMRNLGMKANYMGADGSYSVDFIKLAGIEAEGAYASNTGAPKEKFPDFPAFENRFKAKFQKEPGNIAPISYDAARVMIAAMKKAHSADPKKYLPELAKIQYKGVIGEIAFEPSGDIKNGAITLYQVNSGVWVEVKP
jgi:branched-chain amino acid transport system substrate-binding protein